jgi:hypothetical protein
MPAFSLLFLFSLLEEELVDRAESPWDGPARRPSHAD